MKIKEGTKLASLISGAKMCEEDVFFKTEDGDVLNLKSFLSTLVLQTLVDDKSITTRGSIACLNENDYKVLAEFLED